MNRSTASSLPTGNWFFRRRIWLGWPLRRHPLWPFRSVGTDGAVIGTHAYGISAPLKDLPHKVGLTPDKVAETARHLIVRQRDTVTRTRGVESA